MSKEVIAETLRERQKLLAEIREALSRFGSSESLLCIHLNELLSRAASELAPFCQAPPRAVHGPKYMSHADCDKCRQQRYYDNLSKRLRAANRRSVRKAS